MEYLREFLEVWRTILTSGPFWILYAACGIGFTYALWHKHHDEIQDELALTPFANIVAAITVILWWAMWPYLAFWELIYWARDQIEDRCGDSLRARRERRHGK